jgi:PAS domain S-box-containing protein
LGEDDVRLLESAAPVIGIALRSVRLLRANRLALAQSVRIQEVAGLAGQDLHAVVASIAAQAGTMLAATGVACWALDDRARPRERSSSGDPRAERVLGWSGLHPGVLPEQPVRGENRDVGWAAIPLRYSDRLVGAIGAVSPPPGPELPGQAALEFARHAAVAIENARLAQETRGRISTLQAVAAFGELDPTRPELTRSAMAALVERALAPAGGELWLVDGTQLQRAGASGPAGAPAEVEDWVVSALRDETESRRLKGWLRTLTGERTIATPILVDGRLAGMVTARAEGETAETRRLMAVLAGQAAIVLARVALLDVLDRERRMLNVILGHSPVGVVLEDGQGRIVYANPAVERIYRLAPDAVAGLTLDELLAGAGAIPLDEVGSDVGEGAEYRLRDRSIRVRRVPVSGVEGGASGVLTLHEDVTEERELLETKELMLRAIGHEVRSPAAAMRSSLGSLLQWETEIDPERRQALVHEAYEASGRLLSLVEGQLTISRLETGAFQPTPAAVPLAEAMTQVLAVLRSRYGEQVDRVQMAVPDAIPPAFCEPTHLDQVLANLVGNALEYSTGQVTVSVTASGDWLEVSVADRGPGLSPERVHALFEKSTPAGGNRSQGGLGLGLYLCRLVVERSFRGRIWHQPSDGGAKFCFTVPAHPAPVAAGARG